MSDAPPPALVSRAQTPPLVPYVVDLWRRRQFTWSLAAGNMRGQHLDTVLGNIWHILNPTLMMLVYYFVFGVLIGTSRGVVNFIGWLGVGVFTFGLAQRTISACGSSISNNIGLVRSLQFPRAILPISTVLQELLGYGFAFVVMVGLLLLTGEGVSGSWLLAPVVIVLMTMFAAGAGLIVARLTDRVRDVANVLPFVFRILFYLSGIIFSLEAFVTDDAAAVQWTGIPAATLRRWFVLNPIFTYIELLRDVLMSSYEAEYVREAWTVAILGAPVSLVAGLMYFRGGEKTYGRG